MSQLICVFDTETTGLPAFKQPSDHPDQPHIVDICALLYTPEGELVDSFEAMVRPDGWSIPNEVSVIHGITNEIALEHGIAEAAAIEGFLDIWNRAGLRVAHNVSFDDRIMRIGFKRFQDAWVAESYREAAKFCTCQATTNIVQCPPTEKMIASGRGHLFKQPTVAEALKFFTGEDLVGGHRARPDAEACARVYFALQAYQSAA
ncbi:3'-5' exonuclease [Pseudomonas sp. S 311-6]|uniref:3'-5' exonuclease n=1 Tax=Pseudomonas TaxID=286 RepID=UPI002096C044|nr:MULTISPECIES: 3'-5' exonuclease [Pseudomonas]MCO7567798.1 3'-5' exonuclease [Pseudomonas mosselii]MCO7619355.1 3'-5' exonuclease [Pseudomonas guariconensis]MCO7635189.1 3'-5' exonuclease [Pseudomonas sp. S 311-6]